MHGGPDRGFLGGPSWRPRCFYYVFNYVVVMRFIAFLSVVNVLYVTMGCQTYSREHLLRMRNDTLKVNRQTRKQLFVSRIWNPRRQLRNTTSSAGKN